MNTQNLTANQIYELGIEALMSKLGAAGMIRFLHQHKMGKGNYSVDRHQWLTVPDVETLASQIQGAREDAHKELEKIDEPIRTLLQDMLQKAEEAHEELRKRDQAIKPDPQDTSQIAKPTDKELQKIDEAITNFLRDVLKCSRPTTEHRRGEVNSCV